MPSVVNTTTFPNKKPKATLTGSAIQSESIIGNANVIKLGFGVPLNRVFGKVWPTVPGTNEASVVVTTPSNSLVIIAGAGVGWLKNTGNGTLSVRVLDGTTILKTANLAVGDDVDAMLDVLFVGVPNSGTRTYHVQCWNTNGDALMYVTLSVSHVQLTDTHAASSKNINIING